jgi:diaminopimelate decarboxylase
MTEIYLPPTISGELGRSTEAAVDRNRYSRGVHTPVLTEIDGIPVDRLVEQFGSPLFVFSEKNLRAKADRLRRAFSERYPNTTFAWSYKTNYLNAICQVFHSEKWDAEVVSDFEYQKARNLGIDGENIILNGPHKPKELLETAIREHALIQVDNWDELGLLQRLVAGVERPVDVGLRVWMDAGVKPVWSKFGFALANGEAARAAAAVMANPNLHLHTLHTHIGTYILEPKAYRNAARGLVSLRELIYVEHDHLIECINLGGGFPSYSKLHGMFGAPESIIPPVEAYAAAITGVLNDLPKEKQPLLRLETGRHLVDEAGYLLTKIVAVKGNNRLPLEGSDLMARDAKEWLLLSEHARNGYIVDAGVNLLYTATWFNIQVKPARLVKVPPVPSRLYGNLCMAIDVIRDQVELPPLEAGDILTLHPVGAYNLTQSMQFIAYRPAVVLISEAGTPEIIRKRENLDDVSRAERLPEHLAK